MLVSPMYEILTPLYTCHANLIEDVAPHSRWTIEAGNFIHNGRSAETMCCKVHVCVIGVESDGSPSRPLHRPTLVCEQCIGLHSTGDHNCLEGVGLWMAHKNSSYKQVQSSSRRLSQLLWTMLYTTNPPILEMISIFMSVAHPKRTYLLGRAWVNLTPASYTLAIAGLQTLAQMNAYTDCLGMR